MRVVFAGHTGLEKAVVVRNLIEYSASQLDSAPALFEIERIIEEETRQSHMTLLETSNPAYSDVLWDRAFQKVYGESQAAQPENAFLTMHLTFHVPGRSPMPYLVDHLAKFKTTHIVTLIDDIFEVQARIERVNATRFTDYHITLRELAWWRAHEIGMGAWLAKNLPATRRTRGGPELPVEHYVVAVKHPPVMLHRLLFEPSRPRVYASFPITAVRESAERREEITNVRTRLNELFTVFDPLTIDELSPRIIEEARSNPASEIVLDLSNPAHRWPLLESETLARGRSLVNPITLDARQVLDVTGEVEHAIQVRDFGLVDGCNCVVGYRPNYEGTLSKGMFSEFQHAHNTCQPPKTIHFFWKMPDDGSSWGPFGLFRTRHTEEEEFWAAVKNLHAP